MPGANGNGTGAVTYAEVRRWARWLDTFTATDLANALHADHAVAVRGVKALLHQGVCVDTGDTLDGEQLIEYVPLPAGPREHFTEPPPEIVVPREMGGDPLRVQRGVPVGMRVRGKTSVSGQWRPGRTQGGRPK